MKKTLSLKKSSDFQKVLKKGKWCSGDYLTIYVSQIKIDSNMLGIAVSKKGLKSVQRNKIKRLIKEAYRNMEESIKTGYNIVILWKSKNSFDKATYLNIKNDIDKCLKKSNLLI